MKLPNFKNLILFENEDFILINKPPHISTLHNRVIESEVSLIELARDYFSDVQAAHRLDKETSGILIFAKNPDAYRHISLQFEHRQVAKLYHAIVEGIQDYDNVAVNFPILPLKTGAVKIDVQEGKEALTFFKTLEAFQNHTLVECRPITGRMHQIRIHLSVLDSPIVFDEQYGGEKLYLSDIKRNFNLKKNTEEQPLIQRVALHAFSIQFQLLNGEDLYQEAEYPKDIRALVNQLRKNI